MGPMLNKTLSSSSLLSASVNDLNSNESFVVGNAKTEADATAIAAFTRSIKKNKALESQIGFTPDFDERAVAPEDRRSMRHPRSSSVAHPSV